VREVIELMCDRGRLSTGIEALTPFNVRPEFRVCANALGVSFLLELAAARLRRSHVGSVSELEEARNSARGFIAMTQQLQERYIVEELITELVQLLDRE
jgi:hypothetical protein